MRPEVLLKLIAHTSYYKQSPDKWRVYTVAALSIGLSAFYVSSNLLIFALQVLPSIDEQALSSLQKEPFGQGLGLVPSQMAQDVFFVERLYPILYPLLSLPMASAWSLRRALVPSIGGIIKGRPAQRGHFRHRRGPADGGLRRPRPRL